MSAKQSSTMLGLAVPFAFADGSGYMLIFLLIGLAGVVIGYFTRIGSGINPRPYAKRYSGAPGANAPGEVSGHDPHQGREWMRGRGMR